MNFAFRIRRRLGRSATCSESTAGLKMGLAQPSLPFMTRNIANVTVVVRDYDEVIAYYTGTTKFSTREFRAFFTKEACKTKNSHDKTG